MNNIKVNVLDTPDKFCRMADEIVPVLAEILRDVNQLREQMSKRFNKLKESQPGGIYSAISPPGMGALWQEYKERYHAILDPHCTKNFLDKRLDCCQSFGASDFSSLDTVDAEASFLMKSKSKAVIIVYKEKEKMFQLDYRFTMRLEDDIWKIDEVAFRHSSDEKFYIQHYM